MFICLFVQIPALWVFADDNHIATKFALYRSSEAHNFDHIEKAAVADNTREGVLLNLLREESNLYVVQPRQNHCDFLEIFTSEYELVFAP